MWAFEAWPDIEGRCRRDGITIDDLLVAPGYESVGVFLSMMIDDASNALGGNRSMARDECLRMLRGEAGEVPGVGEQPNPETWGLEPDHQAGLVAAIGSFEAPAGLG